MYACITRETFVFTVFRRVFHSILKLELCRHACRRRDQIIPTCRCGKNMPTTALLHTLIFFEKSILKISPNHQANDRVKCTLQQCMVHFIPPSLNGRDLHLNYSFSLSSLFSSFKLVSFKIYKMQNLSCSWLRKGNLGTWQLTKIIMVLH